MERLLSRMKYGLQLSRNLSTNSKFFRPVCNQHLFVQCNSLSHYPLQMQVIQPVSFSTRKLMSKRWSSQDQAIPPYEMDTNLSDDVTVFTYHNERLYRMMTIFGIVQFLFWGNLAVFAYNSFKSMDGEQMKKSVNPDTILGKLLILQADNKKKIAGVCCLLGYLILCFTFIYPQRAVKKLTLLRGGTLLKVTTYTHFGLTKELTVPLENVSCKQSRHSTGPSISMKIKNRWFYFNLDKRTGKFHDTKLYDHVIGLKRNLKRS